MPGGVGLTKKVEKEPAGSCRLAGGMESIT